MQATSAVPQELWSLRKQISIEKVLTEHYKVKVRDTNREHVKRAQCPLPGHPADSRDMSFEVCHSSFANKWRCRSARCIAARNVQGEDVIAFVALMEKCSPADAAEKLRKWYGPSQGKLAELVAAEQLKELQNRPVAEPCD